MFRARVHTPPATEDPAGVAISQGEGRISRRRTLIGTVSVLLFVALLGGVASIRAVWGPPAGADQALTFDAYFGRDEQTPSPAPPESLPIIAMPVDVHVGTALWTTDGRQLKLPGVNEVVEVVRVPDGWLYSDDFRLHLLTLGGQLIPIVASNLSAWTVSNDGSQVATVADDTVLALKTPTGTQKARTTVPNGARAVAFDGARVVLSRSDRGSDSWSGESASYREAWDAKLVVVYGGRGGDAVGLYQQGSDVCLVDLRTQPEGWQVTTILGCGDLPATAAKAGYGMSRAARSPDGRWLAVPSPTGVHLVDLQASRVAAAGGLGGPPVVAHTCLSLPDAPAVWSDADTVLTISTANGVIACGTDGGRASVQLPGGVSDGWALVRRYGVG